MNIHCLKHPSTISKIDKGIKQAVAMSFVTTCRLGWSLVKNAKGETLMHVRYAHVGQRTELKFFDKHLQDISNCVKTALRASIK